MGQAPEASTEWMAPRATNNPAAATEASTSDRPIVPSCDCAAAGE